MLGREKKATKKVIAAELKDWRGNVGYEGGEDAVNAEHEPKLDAKKVMNNIKILIMLIA